MTEREQPIPTEERLRLAFLSTVEPLIKHVHSLGKSHYDRFNVFTEGIATNGTRIFWGTKRYNQDMERAGANSWQRPFGIEIGSLTPNIQVVLYPTIIYQPDEEHRKIAEEENYQIREEGTQTMVYFLDKFEEEVVNMYDLTANLLFISHMIDATLIGKYPFEQGERSTEFTAEVRDALADVKEYISALAPEQKNKVSIRIAQLGSLNEEGLEHEAKRRVLYDAEPMKTPGLYESSGNNTFNLTPQLAVQNRETYLKLDERDLPQRAKTGRITDVPASPWTEFGKNRWNRNHQLFGRYETPIVDGALRVDFRLDSTHMPALYGFFDTIEITQTTTDGICEQIIFGQEMGEKADLNLFQFFGAKLTPEQLQDSVIPIIIAGKFDFSNPQTQKLLRKLEVDKGTKPDVGRVIADVLRLSLEGRLQRVEKR